ncbi:hypothetical protein GGX14DRAFT_403444 [Mycena pura]|uniref:Alpha-type protein kinase domain-containing protein n=1 Tax=Mycena pura TaxID=153505 RepID=A0AAD6UZU5_9AGAR|nr:hypothetical protein GGX14DRAFT_403444 [Mycena pura]
MLNYGGWLRTHDGRRELRCRESAPQPRSGTPLTACRTHSIRLENYPSREVKLSRVVGSAKPVFISDYLVFPAQMTMTYMLPRGRVDEDSDVVLLADPQIMTNPSLGKIFASGNVAASCATFQADHKCNTFCSDFGWQPFSTAIVIHDFDAYDFELAHLQSVL